MTVKKSPDTMDLDLLFTQKEGFVAFAPPERFRWRDGEDENDWLRRVGLRNQDVLNRGAVQELQNSYSDGQLGDLQVRMVEQPEAEDPHYVVEVWGIPGYDHFTSVWVRTRADLLALLLELAKLQVFDLRGMIGDLKLLVQRAYRVQHGHEADEVCRTCDPNAARDRDREREERRRISERHRIFFLLNREGGRVLMVHKSTPEEMEAHVARIQVSQPELVLALAQPGTGMDFMELEKRFKPHLIRAVPKFNGLLFAATSEILSFINEGRKRQGQEAIGIIAPTSAN